MISFGSLKRVQFLNALEERLKPALGKVRAAARPPKPKGNSAMEHEHAAGTHTHTHMGVTRLHTPLSLRLVV